MVFSMGLTVGILLFSEILPKNAGVIYRRSLQPALVPVLRVVRWCMAPLAKVCSVTVNFVIQKNRKRRKPAMKSSCRRKEREGRQLVNIGAGHDLQCIEPG